MFKKSEVLYTGYRLLCILNILFKENLQKPALMRKLKYEHNISDISDETLKLDINTLKKAGFKIKRGNMYTDFKIRLDRNFVMLKLIKEDITLLNMVKKFALEFADSTEIENLQKLYKKLKPYVKKEDYKTLVDFGFYNNVDIKILNSLNNCIKKRQWCTIVYISSNDKKKEVEIFPDKIVPRNNKLYLNFFSKIRGRFITIKLSKIQSISSVFEVYGKFPVKFKDAETSFTTYTNLPFNIPAPSACKIKKISQHKQQIISEEENVFFTIQNILSFGKYCTNISNEKIKNKILEHLVATRELYK